MDKSLCRRRTLSLSVAELLVRALLITSLMRDAARFWLLSGNRRRARDRRARAWAECGRSSRRRSILRCRSIRFLFMLASLIVWVIFATNCLMVICFALRENYLLASRVCIM